MTNATLNVRRFVCSGQFQENCYVVWPDGPAERQCFIIDPGAGQNPIVRIVEGELLKPAGIVLTHGHMDHIAGIDELLARWSDLPVMIGRGDGDALTSPHANLSAMLGIAMRLASGPTRLLDDGEELSLGELKFKVLSTPGHSPGGICLHCPASGDLFSGDVLLAGSVGRTDFPGGDGRMLMRSIRDKLLNLPDETRVWPGHGEDTTIGQERRTNFFLSRG